jgi:rare lipoprotein A
MARVSLPPVLLLLCSLGFASDASAEIGRASWYALTSVTASGESCNPNALTAAHPTLPFGTIVKVENIGNGRSVFVRINDRGPFVDKRVIDLTRAAARRLGFLRDGLTTVRIKIFSGRSPRISDAMPPRPAYGAL